MANVCFTEYLIKNVKLSTCSGFERLAWVSNCKHRYIIYAASLHYTFYNASSVVLVSVCTCIVSSVVLGSVCTYIVTILASKCASFNLLG